MVLPRWLAQLNRSTTNRVTGPLAPYLPGFGVVLHTGRTSGRLYRTPVNVFRVPDGFVFALTYGPATDWVRNVLAEGGCILETESSVYRLTQPRLVHDSERRAIDNPVVNLVLARLHVTDFLRLQLQPQRKPQV